jgi:hypothetical protein
MNAGVAKVYATDLRTAVAACRSALLGSQIEIDDVERDGHRIGAVRQLRHNDLILGEHPKVRWRAETDKTGKEWATPISPEVHERLMKVRRERATGGDMPLFPAPMDRSRPVRGKDAGPLAGSGDADC